MDKLTTCLGSLRQLDVMIWAYRAEIEWDGLLYKFWKEFGITRRLEIFRPGDYCPSEMYRFVVIGDERNYLPKELWDSDNWKIYNLLPPMK